MPEFLLQSAFPVHYRIADHGHPLMQFLHIGQDLMILQILLAGDTALQLPDLLLTSLDQPSALIRSEFLERLQIDLPYLLRNIVRRLFLCFLPSAVLCACSGAVSKFTGSVLFILLL